MGPVGSVKIMWPRSDGTQGPGADMTNSRRNKSTGLSGFVSFMKRKDAEAALRELDGFDWGGSILRVGWSKAVPLASRPKYGASEYYEFITIVLSSISVVTKSRSPSRERQRSRSRSPIRQATRRSRSRSSSRARSYSRSRSPRRRHRSYSRSRHGRRSRSGTRRTAAVSDDDDTTDAFIRTVAAEVRGHGDKYEDILREREKNNTRYLFMTDRKVSFLIRDTLEAGDLTLFLASQAPFLHFFARPER
jgi:U2-associated protein SR140